MICIYLHLFFLCLNFCLNLYEKLFLSVALLERMLHGIWGKKLRMQVSIFSETFFVIFKEKKSQ